jgi:hypothetical protein
MRRAVLLAATVAALLALGASAASAAPSWLSAQAISAPAATSYAPKVAMDPAGDSVAVWESDENGEEGIVAATRPAGGSWGAPVTLRSAPAGIAIYSVTVAIAANGAATAAWEVQPGGAPYLEAASMAPGGSWSEPTLISTPGNPANDPRLAVDSAGDVTAVWHEFSEGSVVVMAATRAAGGTWTSPRQLSPPHESAELPVVAVDDQGDAVIVWTGILHISAVTRSRGGAWSEPVELTPAGELVRPPDVAMNAAGEAVAVWSLDEGAHYVAQARAMSPAGTWGPKADLSDGTFDAEEAQVGLDSTGEAIAIWRHSTGSLGVIEGAIRPSGSAWGAAAPLTPAGQVASSPDLAMSATGHAALAWEGGASSETMTPFAITRPAGGAWSAPRGLAPNAKLGNYPKVAVDAGGDAVAAWESYGDGTSDVIEAAGFDGQGPRVSDVSIPTTGQVGAPLHFSVRATDVWSPIGERFWQFGDGSVGLGEAVDHAYLKAGSFPINLRVTDAAGNSTIVDGGPVAVAAAPAPGGGPRGLAHARRPALVTKGRAALELHCVGGDCAGVAKLYAPPPRGVKRRRRRPVLAGEASFRIAAGGHAVVKVKLRPNVLTRLRKSRTLRLGTTLRGTDIAPGKVILHEAKRKHRQHRR